MSTYSIYDSTEFNTMSEKQKKLFRTAIQLFASKGFSKTSTAEISRTAKVSEGLLFKTFGNKEGILSHIIRPIALNILPPNIEMALDQGGQLSLSLFVQNYYEDKINFVTDNEELIKILIREVIYDPTIIKTYQAALPKNFWASTHACLDELKQKGLIADWNNQYLFRSLNSALIVYILRNYLFETRLDPHRVDYTILATVKALQP